MRPGRAPLAYHRCVPNPSELAARPDDHDDGPPADSRYQRLDSAAVRESTARLQQRIRSRFPDRGLWEVCSELLGLVDEVIEGGGISRRRVSLARLLSRAGIITVIVVSYILPSFSSSEGRSSTLRAPVATHRAGR